MKIEIITKDYDKDLARMVNEFIRERTDILDIKYSISNGGVYTHTEYSAMIMLKD